MTVLIDGKAISTTTVSAPSWSSYPTAATINAGAHTLSIASTNAQQSLCGPLFLDTVAVVAGTSGTGPTGTPVTITAASTTWYHVVPTTYAYQPAGSYWWAYNLGVQNPPGPQWVQYYPNNFPNYTTCGWTNSSAVGAFPELVYGIQGPNDDPNGTSMGPLGTAGLPPWVNTPLRSLRHINFQWNLTANADAAANNNFDILTETWLGPVGGMGNETAFILKRPAGWWPQTAYQHPVGGVSYIFIPNAMGAGSLAIMPASVYNGSGALASGSVDLLPILSYAAKQGWTSMSYVLKGWEFGCEYTTGSGSVTWNNINFTVS